MEWAPIIAHGGAAWPPFGIHIGRPGSICGCGAYLAQTLSSPRRRPVQVQAHRNPVYSVLRNGIVIIIVYARRLRRRRRQSTRRVRSLHIAHPAQHRARSFNPIAGTATIQDDRRWMMSSVGRSVAWSEPNMHACACPGGHKSLLHHPCSHPCVVGIRCIFCAAPTSSPPQHRFEAGTTATEAARR